jgi:glycopeptide antibiotics resistance protein
MMSDIKNKWIKVLHNFLLYGVMFFYLMILFILLFHKKSIGSFQSVNLMPFRTIDSYLFNDDLIHESFVLSNILGNIIIFIPLGIYMTLVNRNKLILVNTILVTLLSLLVEIAQFIFAVGATDIDDIILNTIGGLLGVLLFHVISYLFKDKTKLAIEVIAPAGGIVAFAILFFMNR